MTCPLILIDGSSYFFRAFHALPPLNNSKGQPTGAIYGVANMIKRLIREYHPTQMAVVFDAKGKTFRDEWYPAYKAHRPPMPENLQCQFEPLLALLTAMGLPILLIEGVEADDVIGTLSRQAELAGVSVLISTGDKDMAQLVTEQVTLINTMTNQTLDIAGVQQKFGVYPEQIVDYLSLVGDTTDNIPGVPQCGPKTAVKWLCQYQTLDALIAEAATISGKIGDAFRLSLPQLPLSKKLVTIRCDLTLPVTVDSLHLKPPDTAQLIQLTRELEFKTWLKELLGSIDPDSPIRSASLELSGKSRSVIDKPQGVGFDEIQEKEATNSASSAPVFSASFEVITTYTAFEHWLNKLHNASVFCVDTETTDLNALTAEIVGIALAIDPIEPAYIPLSHDDGSTQLPRDVVLARLKPIFENVDIKKVGQNIKYDYSVLKNYGIDLKGIAYDTMLESYLLNSTATRHDMDSLALKYLGYQTIRFEDIAGTGLKQRRFNQIPVVEAAPYAAEDAEVTLRLHQTLYPMMDETLQRVLHEIEVPLITILADMERHGVIVDKDILLHHGKRLKERCAALETEAYALAEGPFNLNSPKQLQTILYETQGLPILAKTPKGQPSTAEAVLQELAFDYRLPAVIVEYRQLTKLVSTYIEALPKRINPLTQRVHTSYNQAIAATGRLSSSEPNLQNIPIRREEGRLIRTAFIAPPQHVLLTADYSQIELRIMAHLSQDKTLLASFINGLDVHAATASEIFSIPLADVSKEQRRRAKAVNFGLIYGMSSFGLAKQLGIERQEAERYVTRYFERYPGVFDYMDSTRCKAYEQGYVETLFGRRLYLPDIHAQNKMRKKAAERTAINAPMQGTAADIIKKAMIAISSWQYQHNQTSFSMIMQVHDELVFEVAEHAVEETKAIVRHLMEHTVELSIPLSVSIGIGKNWEEAH